MEMNLPDFMKYKDKFSNSGFIERTSRTIKYAGAKLTYVALILYYTLEDDKVSVRDKAIVIGALGYLISPLDVVPDAIPIAGLSDDLAILIYMLHKAWDEVSDEVKRKAKAKVNQWLDLDKINSAGDTFTERPEDTPVQKAVQLIITY